MSKSSFTSLFTDVENVSKLDDLPNATGGLTAAQLKAVFDKAGVDIKTFINSTLIAELAKETVASSGASRIGIEPIVALAGANNVMDALSSMISLITSTSVPDGGITTIKLADDAVTAAKIDDGAVETAALASAAVTPAKCDFTGAALTVGAPASGVDPAVPVNINGPIILNSESYGNDLPGTAVTGQLFFKKV